MVSGPAALGKPFVAETGSLCFESEIRSFESDERNLFRVAGTLNAVVGNRSITMSGNLATPPDARGPTELIA
ncbi:hypothetical protein JNB91_09955 [Rhizobium wenxiniae]|uniref:hypothetical protein n=1 Tax=Rhizobium wenxiniae TaxID=1737357 RepID=UPI001C6F29A0|nr:hypothetical protein [Rhizobium wenxiniae]MBW9088166.1 hypothetical protein [Rhizobium wenxiniae]